ncbi:hypothetical protein [Vulcanimicrobium alpinum]|nr:hypothetical protein [Vulcanimicrobium alpinum]
MRTMLMTAAVAAAALIPGIASADDAMAGHAMAAHGAMATMVCRVAAGSEKPNAMMMAGQKPMICKPVAVTMKDGRLVNGPDLSHALTVEQANAAFAKWYAETFSVVTGGG